MYKFYHNVPENMIGDKLRPLNNMDESMSGLRTKYLEKYEGREEVLEKRVPLLDCLWNDVVQFLPLDPRKVFGLQVKMGFIPEMPDYKFFEINPEDLDPSKTVVYFKSASGDDSIEVKWLKDVDLASLQDIPQETIAYYESIAGTGELPFNYQFIPHILHMGDVDVSGVDRISLDQT